MESHLFFEWSKLIIEDNMFEGELDENKWIIDDTNAQELIEALNYAQNDYLLEEEIISFIEENNS